MRFFCIGLALSLAILSVSCRTKDNRTVLIYVPEMKNIACGEVVTRAIMKCSSVDASKIQIDFTKRTVSVTYDSLITALKNIEFSIAEAGFQANEVPANEAAAKALPLECKLTGPN